MAVALSAFAVSVAAPFAALAFVDETEAPTTLRFDVAAGQQARQLFVDDVYQISVTESASLRAFRELSDPGPSLSDPLPPAIAAAISELAEREPSVPEPGFGSFREPTPTPTPLPPRNPAPPEAPAPPPITDVVVRVDNVNLTFYSCLGEGFCGNMANGEPVYEGAVACSYDLPIGARLRIYGDPTGRVYVCKDRGLLTPTWIDVFWYDPADGWAWQAAVGRIGAIQIVSLP